MTNMMRLGIGAAVAGGIALPVLETTILSHSSPGQERMANAAPFVVAGIGLTIASLALHFGSRGNLGPMGDTLDAIAAVGMLSGLGTTLLGLGAH